ncbi:phosphoribosylglycinamide formyltransferase [Limibacter armeniacum]|uniref:phosphoribosylglycinamide formyltransferase n=1 Tax=Limibacter armeniacum TaxID=466084 RepID=UPI002FE640C1
MKTINIAILASGTGSNAVKIIEHFKGNEQVNFIVISNRKEAKVLESATSMGVQSHYFNRKDFYENGSVLNCLKDFNTDLVILAGFLWLVPEDMLEQYPDRILNIHPALLPKFGGKGMYGMNVHKAVVAKGEKQSGITIHFCNKHYDEGRAILQASCDIAPDDSPEEVARKVLQLEHFYYPRVIERMVIQALAE